MGGRKDGKNENVNRRIGGLEIVYHIEVRQHRVNRRIGGLEIFGFNLFNRD